MALTSIGSQLTPGTPAEVTLAGALGLPSGNQQLILIGHQSATLGSASGNNYVAVKINNVQDPVAAKTEAEGLFGAGTELAKMVVAAVAVNQGGGTFPPIIAIPLAPADSDHGQALATADKLNTGASTNYLVSCYDGNTQALANALLLEAKAMSGAQRVEMGQFGCIAVMANRTVTDPSNLFKYDSAYGSFCWLRDTSSPAQLIGEVAAAHAAVLAAQSIPYNPVKNVQMPNLTVPAKAADWITVGAGAESETALQQGWCPLRVLPNGIVAQVRSVTLRRTTGDGVTTVTGYFDVQDFNVLYFWRKTICTRFNQPDFTNVKASPETEKLALSEVIRLANLFQDQGMFQAVDLLAKQFIVQRNVSDRSRLDVFTPVNVIPVLAVIATNIQGSTQGDTITV